MKFGDLLRPRTLALYYVMVALAGGAFAAPGNDGMAVKGPGGSPTPKLSPPALAPAAVTDLRVSAVTDSSAVLTWTEVSTGGTGVARYVIHFGVPGFSWGGTSDVTTGGCGAPVYGSTAAGGRVRSCVLGRLTPNLAYEFQLVAYTGVLNSTAVFGPLSNRVGATTAQRIGPMLVLRSRMSLDSVEFFTVSLPFDFGDRRYPLHGRFPFGDRVVYFYDVRDSLVARAYVLVTKP